MVHKHHLPLDEGSRAKGRSCLQSKPNVCLVLSGNANTQRSLESLAGE